MTPLELRKALRPRPVAVAALLAALAAAVPPAWAIEVQCAAGGDGDAFGWSVASGGDYDGDGTADVAVGAPCAWVGTMKQAGRVRVFSGATGGLLVSLVGSKANERYGSALAFVPDVNADGKAELAIGAYRFDAPREIGGVREAAGRVELRSAKQGGTVVWEAQGPNEEANLGESIATLADVNGDGKADLAVGASGALVDQGDGESSRDGVAYVLSGANGAQITKNDALYNDEHWGSVVASAGDVNGDGTSDWLAAANAASLPGEVVGLAAAGLDPSTTTTTTTTTSTTSTTLVEQVGRLDIISGKPPYGVLVELIGDKANQRLGRSAVATSDGSGDGKTDVWVGSSGADVGNQVEAGAIDLYSVTGAASRHLTEPTPQSFAAFGTSVAAPGSLDSGAGKDVVAGAPLARVAALLNVGRVHAFDANGGGLLWSCWPGNTSCQNDSLEGSATPSDARFGSSLAAGIDYNEDGVQDVVVGAPGASPNGRRGAGSAYILSGKNGRVLDIFGGRRGRETRLFVAGPGLDHQTLVRGFDPFGRRREAEIRAFRGRPTTAVSMAILDPAGRDKAAQTLFVLGAGRGGGTNNVAVYKANRRKLRVSLFPMGPPGYLGGVNVAGGNFVSNTDAAGDEIAVVPADDVTGTADVVIYRRNLPDPFGRITDWTKVRTFPAFTPEDMIEGNTVDADGVNIVGGNVLGTSNTDSDEIIVSPIKGFPGIRLLNSAGVKLADRQVYPPNGGSNSGVSIAVGDLAGDGKHEILTAPAKGQLLVRAWQYRSGQGECNCLKEYPLQAPGFFIPDDEFGATFDGGLTIAAADVDFDGVDEIIVAPGKGTPARILAFEAESLLQGQAVPVAGWRTFEPYGPLADGGVSLFGMNDYWRR